MKRAASLIITCFLALNASTQEISVTFSATGAASMIDSIKATNLSTDNSVLLPGDGTLVLTDLTGFQEIPVISKDLSIFPNPFSGNTNIHALIKEPQIIEIQVINMMAQVIAQTQLKAIPGKHEFRLNIGQPGIYTVSLITQKGTAVKKVLCAGISGNPEGLIYNGICQNSVDINSGKDWKTFSSTHTLGYSPGDVIHYKCMSTNMTTIITDTLPTSGNYTVEFAECVDPDRNSYPIVRIGSMIWMARNLAYMPYVSPGPEGSDSGHHFYVSGYNGSSLSEARSHENFKKYGVLYNWKAARISCPTGWHLPSDEEWKMMEEYLGMSRFDLDEIEERNSGEVGRKLKANKGWGSYGNGINSSGFSGIPGGIRDENGNFSYLGYSAYFWTDSEVEYTKAWGRALNDYDNGIIRGNTYRRMGFAVRCVKNLSQ